MQLKRLNELEDIVADQDNSIAALREKLTKARQETADWAFKCDELTRASDESREQLMRQRADDARASEQRLEALRRELNDKERETLALQQELDVQREANARAPTAAMKNMVERLKNELGLKEKQQQVLETATLLLHFVWLNLDLVFM